MNKLTKEELIFLKEEKLILLKEELIFLNEEIILLKEEIILLLKCTDPQYGIYFENARFRRITAKCSI